MPSPLQTQGDREQNRKVVLSRSGNATGLGAGVRICPRVLSVKGRKRTGRIMSKQTQTLGWGVGGG